MAVLGLMLLAGGCGRKPSPPSPPESAYVSLDRLVAIHPLADELHRLDVAAERLERLAGSPGGTGAAAIGREEGRTYTLSPLVLPALPGGDFSREEVRLRRAGGQYLNEFGQRLESQRAAAERRRREDLQAVAEARQAARRRDAEAEVVVLARALRERNATRITNLVIRINTLEARIAIVPPPPDHDILRAQIAVLRDELEVVRRQRRDAEAQARQEAQARLARAARADAVEIDRLLIEERSRAKRSVQSLVRTQRAALEEELAELTASPRVGANTAGPYRIEAPFARTAPASGSLKSAIRRIQRQREVLREFIRNDTIATVRDIAARHNIAVAFDRSQKDAPDRTSQFAAWITNNQAKGNGTWEPGREGNQT